MEKRTILVTGIGGNVGQGILRNIISLNKPITVIGTGVEDFSGGNHLCDKYYKLPYSYNDSYINEILKIVEGENVTDETEPFEFSVVDEGIPPGVEPPEPPPPTVTV